RCRSAAKDRVWLVLDGDTLYVDKNGNGDLTDEGESIKAPAFGPRNELGHRERSIEVSAISVAGLTHSGLVVRQVEHSRNRVVYTVTISLDPKCYGIFTDTKDLRVRHRAGQLVFAERPQDAPVIHFGGPLTLCVGPDEKFRRGDDSGEVSFWLGTPGLE